MSVTLTDRDTGTIVITQAASLPGEAQYSVSGGTLSDYRSAKARHSNMGAVSKNSRHNFRLERFKINAAGALKSVSVDITISVPNDGTFGADDVDDLVTAAGSYFATEADTGNFIVGANRT